MKRADIYIIIAILLPAIIGAVILLSKHNNSENLAVEIFISGDLYKSIPLTENLYDIKIHSGTDGYNIIQILDNKVYITEANCKSQTCVLTGKISYPGQIIACLPHRILVKLAGQTESELDAIAY